MRSCFLTSLALSYCLVTGATAPAQEKVSHHAGIELGSKGVRVLVIEVTRTEGRPSYKRLLATTNNTSLLPLKHGEFTPAALADTAQAVSAFYQLIQTKYQIEPARVDLVGSSSLEQAKNFKELAQRLEQPGGKKLVFIDEETEARLTIAALVPPADQQCAVLIDVGSGNTKGGAALDPAATGKKVAVVKLPVGTVSYAARLKRQAAETQTTLAEAAATLRPEVLTKSLKEQIDGAPVLGQRDKVYLNGGIAWALVTFVHPDKVEAATVKLTAADVEQFGKMLADSQGKLPVVDLGAIKDPRVKEKAERELRQVGDTFTAEQLFAGAEILKALATALHLERREIVFARQGYVSWLAAYVAGDDVQSPPRVPATTTTYYYPPQPAYYAEPLPPGTVIVHPGYCPQPRLRLLPRLRIFRGR